MCEDQGDKCHMRYLLAYARSYVMEAKQLQHKKTMYVMHLPSNILTDASVRTASVYSKA